MDINFDDYIETWKSLESNKKQLFKDFYSFFNINTYQDKLEDDQFLMILLFSYRFKGIDEVKYHCYTSNVFGKVYLYSTIVVSIGGYDENFTYSHRVDGERIEDILLIPNTAKHIASNIKVSEESNKTIDAIKYKFKVVEDELKNELRSLKERLYSNNTSTIQIRKHVKQKCYIMVDGHTNYVKIGKSQNPHHREKTLQAEKPTIKMLHIFDNDIEADLHLRYKDKRIRGEWFDISMDDVNNIIKEFTS